MAVNIIMEKSTFTGRDSSGKEHYRAALLADTTDELPTREWNGIVLEQGSRIDVIDTAQSFKLNSSGEWKESSFSDAIRIKGRVDSVSELPEDAKAGWLYFVGAATDPECAEYVYTEEGTWEHIGEGVPIEVDSALSTTSENPVQNKVINAALTTIDTNGNIFIGGVQITQLIDQDSYDALATKENRFYLVYPTPANNGGE